MFKHDGEDAEGTLARDGTPRYVTLAAFPGKMTSSLPLHPAGITGVGSHLPP